MIDLDGKIAVITGAKGGLGNFTTKVFLTAGANVAGVSRSIAQADFPDARFAAFPAELATGASAGALVEKIIERFRKIDILIHLVGGFAGGKPVSETDDATLERMLDLNLRSAFYMARAVLPVMRASGAGRIVAIGSRAAVEPQPGIAAYSASKAALVSLVRTIAMENQDRGITANVILPGTMDTPANRAADPGADFSKWVDPRQVADLAVWLSSDAASQVTGAVIPVYGKNL
ncbi:MAG TPA: SDR family NAD(P)-dependent oxidoreductase [Bryobacteraceae bacterium]|nr:SDR family NAD(P)-dependent oxidoreductase [Bryobacteraceae bacterium]